MKNSENRKTSLLMSLEQLKPVHLEEVPEEVGSLAEEISSGHRFLKVLAYPWGVEFDVFDGEDQP